MTKVSICHFKCMAETESGHWFL